MAETTPVSAEKTIVVNPPLCRLWTFTIISLSLNALILILLLVCAVVHHYRETHGGSGGNSGQCQMSYGHHFHGRGGPGMMGGYGMRPGMGGYGMMGGHGMRPGMGGYGMMGGHGMRPGMGGGYGMMGGHGMKPGMGGSGMMGGHGMKPGMGGSNSSTPPDPAQMADMMLTHLSSKLTLTDDEKAKIKPILEQQAAQMEKDREAQHETMQKSMEDTRAKIKPLLTPDQQKELDALPLPGQQPAAGQAKPAQ